MKTKHLLGIAFLCLLGLSSCLKDKDLDFKLNGSQSLELTLGSHADCLPIISGNGDYTLTVGDDNIIEALYYPSYEGMPFGSISINGKKRGETTLQVTDNVTKQSYTFQIKITDNYFGCYVTKSDHPALLKERWMYLINNENKDVYFFEKGKDYTPGTLITQGTYEFTVEDNIPYLTLYYADSNGQFTDAAIAPTPRKFNIINSNTNTFYALEYYLGIDWDLLKTEVRSSPAPMLKLSMEEVSSGKEVDLLHLYAQIPSGILP